MCSAIYQCYKNLYYALSAEMVEKGAFSAMIEMNEIEAEKHFANTMRFCKGDDIIKNLCKCVEMYPAQKYLEQIYSKLPKNEYESFQIFIRFWNLDFYVFNQVSLEKKLAVEAKKIRDEEQVDILIEDKSNNVDKEIYKENTNYIPDVYVSYETLEALYYKKCSISSDFKEQIFLANRSPDVLKKVVDSYAKVSKDEIPILIFDNTAFKSAKDGFLLTNKRLYIHNMWEKTIVINNSDITFLILKKGLMSTTIIVNDTRIDLNVIYGKSKDSLFDLLKIILGK